MPELRKLAERLHCTVTDDRGQTKLWIDANDGWSFDDGERSANVHTYGSEGSYRPEWRQDAIVEAIYRLTQDPPINTPYLHNDEEE